MDGGAVGREQWGDGHGRRVRAKLPDMPGSVSGSVPKRVDDPAAARLLLDEVTREVFGSFLDRDRSVREAADHLGRDLDAVLYRVRRLHEAGLLEVVAVQRRAGRPVRRYRAPHPLWFVPFEVLPHADLEETYGSLMRVHADRAARAAARWAARTPWAGYLVGIGADGQVWLRGTRERPVGPTTAEPPRDRSGDRAGPLDAALDLRLTQAQAADLNTELWALVAKYAALGAATAGAANRFLLVVSAPLDASG